MCHSIFRLPYPQLAHGASGSFDLAGLTRGDWPSSSPEADQGTWASKHATTCTAAMVTTATNGTGTVAAISSSSIESLFDIILKRRKGWLKGVSKIHPPLGVPKRLTFSTPKLH